MSTQIKRRRGTTAEHTSFVGAEAELSVDTDKNTVVVHDGSTAGGHPLVKESDLGSAAFVDTGTAAGEVPTNGDLGTMSTQNANNVNITGGSVSVSNLTTNTDADIHSLTVGRGGSGISQNTAIGIEALRDNTTGNQNTAIGLAALRDNTTGDRNTAIGFSALRENTTGDRNTAIGRTALLSNTTGDENTAIGFAALLSNTTGDENTAIGFAALLSNTTGIQNTAIGLAALQENTTGNVNTAIGRQALLNNTTGVENTAIGLAALGSNTTGNGNTANGRGALQENTTGANNIGVGLNAGRLTSPFTVTTQNNRIVMGNNDHTDAYIRIAWTVTSDARDKAETKPIPHGLDFVNQLKPTEYQFKVGGRDGDPDGRRRYGFLAQDVLQVEGSDPVIVDTEDDDNLKLHESYLVPVLVNAIKELTARVEELEQKS